MIINVQNKARSASRKSFTFRASRLNIYMFHEDDTLQHHFAGLNASSATAHLNDVDATLGGGQIE